MKKEWIVGDRAKLYAQFVACSGTITSMEKRPNGLFLTMKEDGERPTIFTYHEKCFRRLNPRAKFISFPCRVTRGFAAPKSSDFIFVPVSDVFKDLQENSIVHLKLAGSSNQKPKPKRDCIRCFRVGELEAEIALLHTLHRDAHQVKVMLKDALTQISQTTTTERGSKELAREALKLLSLGGKAAEPRQHRFLVRLAGSVSPGSYVLCPVDGIPELDRLWAEGITVTFSETEELAALKFVP